MVRYLMSLKTDKALMYYHHTLIGAGTGLLLSNSVRIVRLASSYSATAYVRLLVCAFILFASSPVVVLGQDGLTLDAAVQYALEHSPVMEKETLEQKKTAVDYAKEGSAFLPDIRGYVRYQHYFSDLPVYIFPEDH
mgnify:CR=1 FL=1